MKIFRFIALALIMALALCVLPATAEENEPVKYVEGAYPYILLEDGTAELVGYSGKYDSSTVPIELDGHILSSIKGNPFAENENWLND